MTDFTLQFDTAADLESALSDALQNNEGHVSGIAAYLAQTGGEVVAPEALKHKFETLRMSDRPRASSYDTGFAEGWNCAITEAISHLQDAAAPPAPPAPLPGKENLALLQQAYDALDSMGGFGFTQKASKAMHELHAAITSAKEQTK